LIDLRQGFQLRESLPEHEAQKLARLFQPSFRSSFGQALSSAQRRSFVFFLWYEAGTPEGLVAMPSFLLLTSLGLSIVEKATQNKESYYRIAKFMNWLRSAVLRQFS
jgi:hypothetical protein